MKLLTALAGAAFMTVAVPAVAMDTPPSDPGHGGGGGGSHPVPAPPVAIIFGLAAGAMLVRRKLG